MTEDPIIGLSARMKVITDAIAASSSPSKEMLDLYNYYRAEIAGLERKPWKARHRISRGLSVPTAT